MSRRGFRPKGRPGDGDDRDDRHGGDSGKALRWIGGVHAVE